MLTNSSSYLPHATNVFWILRSPLITVNPTQRDPYKHTQTHRDKHRHVHNHKHKIICFDGIPKASFHIFFSLIILLTVHSCAPRILFFFVLWVVSTFKQKKGSSVWYCASNSILQYLPLDYSDLRVWTKKHKEHYFEDFFETILSFFVAMQTKVKNGWISFSFPCIFNFLSSFLFIYWREFRNNKLYPILNPPHLRDNILLLYRKL